MIICETETISALPGLRNSAAHIGVTPADFEFLVDAFDPDYYKASFFPEGRSELDLLGHFIEEGLLHNFSPSPLVQIETIQAWLPPSNDCETPIILRWLRSDKRHNFTPTHRFDSTFYFQQNPDVVKANMGALDHFVKFGAAEGRLPNALFDADYYNDYLRRAGIPCTVPLYTHYLSHGLLNGFSPRQSLAYVFAKANELRLNLYDLYDRISATSARWIVEYGLGSFDYVAEIFPLSSANDGELVGAEGLVECFERYLATARCPYEITASEFNLLRAMFVPVFYQESYRSDPEEGGPRFAQYLSHGLRNNVSPSPLFENDMIGRGARSNSDKRPAILRWLTDPARHNIVPSRRFDSRHYLARYPDVGRGNLPPFEHFVRYGIYEQREPNQLFDTAWYARISAGAGGPDDLPLYYRYLCRDLPRGVAPRAVLLPLFNHAADFRSDLGAGFDNLLAASKPWLAKYGIHKYDILVALFLSYSYKGIGAKVSDAHPFDRLVEFLEVGARRGVDPGPLFDTAVYLKTAREMGHEVSLHSSAFIDFLDVGIHKRILPTRLFDETAYLREHSDLAKSSIWCFEHFIVFGIFEGRQLGVKGMLTLPRANAMHNSRALHNWAAFWTMFDRTVAASFASQWLYLRQAKALQIIGSKKFDEIIKRAREHEPLVGDVEIINHVLFPPLHDPRNAIRLQMAGRISRTRYETIICIPWLRTGGADLVACLLARSLQQVRPGEQVLLLQTDHDNFERPDWIPDGVERVDISDLLSQMSPADAVYMLFTLLLAFEPARIINVNSRLCWSLFVRFAKRLRPLTALYSYLFCLDQTERGIKSGYPSEFFVITASNLNCTFTDTDYLRHELIRMYRVPDVLASRVVTLHSPPREDRSYELAAEKAASNTIRRRPSVLWAGRLDRQKRFDLVQLIAIVLPEVDFVCWGRPLLDSGPDLSKSPPNLQLHASFQNFSDLPLDQCDVWLYTSLWDGMPTMLVELAHRGVAIVASAVGGVKELVDETTGWSIDEVEDVSAYVAAIQDALARPDERIERARRLNERATKLYSQASFGRELKTVLDKEGVR